MAGKIPPNVMVVGKMGSGKSRYIRELLEGFEGKYQYLVALNTSPEFGEFCNHREVFTLERLEKQYSAEQLATLIKHHGKVFFEVPECDEMFPLVDALGNAVMSLGVYDAEGCTVLLLVDEAHVFMPKNNYVRGLKRVDTEGRKFGVVVLKATQTLVGMGGFAIHHTPIRAANTWAVFPTTEINSRKRIFETLGEIPDPVNYAMPDPEKGWGPEYFVFDGRSNQRGMVRRLPDGTRRFEEVSA